MKGKGLSIPIRSGAVLAIAASLACGMAPASAETPGNALVMAYNIDAISTFDPAQIGEVVTNEIVANTCDTLVDSAPDDASEFVPALAKSWDVSDDSQTITFHLQDNLQFPSGEPATAGDLAWSMYRVVDLDFGNAATLNEYGFTKDSIRDLVTAPDDKTLVMKLDKPYPVQLILGAIAANRVTALLNKAVLLENEIDGDLGNKYLTTATDCVGPYHLVAWNPGEAVVLQANDVYWGEAPKLPQVIIRHVAESGTQRLLLEEGDVDVARDLTPEDLQDLEDKGEAQVARALKPQLFYWTFNNTNDVFSNEKVRLAMRYLIDYQGLADTVMKNIGTPRASFVQLGAFGALDEKEGEPFSLDPDKAKSILEEAGYPDGFEADIILGTAPYAAPVAQSIQANAAKIGVKLNIEQMANAQLFSRVRGRDFQTALIGWMTSVSDAHGMASRHIFNPDNSLEAQATQYPSWRAGYFSEKSNEEVNTALFEQDPEKRKQLYHDLQKEMMQSGPNAYMFQTYDVAGVSNDLKDWTWNGFRVFYDLASK
ncbi:ABC transporter substrate-binding protein [Consotaella aegiceratis]|uniref:ABC transporter substrate-binding protein n=1 Tax=Consotaella aegiceratis TaxID=3097961 RepID=UPI002F3FF631